MKRSVIGFILIVISTFFAFGQNVRPIITYEKEFIYTVAELRELNSKNAEILPVEIEGKLYFMSNHEFDLMNQGQSNWNKNKFFQVYYAELNDTSINGQIQHFKTLESDHHIGPISYCPKRKVLLFSKVISHPSKRREQLSRIYQASWEDGKLGTPELLHFIQPDYSYNHPSVSTDGSILFYASDMPGGMGGFDIYYSHWKDTIWSQPMKLGEQINSKENDAYPFIDGRALYFSSNRKGGSGKLDVYQSDMTSSGWSNPRNLKAPVNTEYDDFGMSISSKGNYGYFTSNRSGNDDLFKVWMSEILIAKSKTIKGQFIYRQLDKKYPDNMKIDLVNQDGLIVSSTYTNEEGIFEFKDLDPEKQYQLIFDKKEMKSSEIELIIFTEDSGEKRFYLISGDESHLFRKLSYNESSIQEMYHEYIDNDPFLNIQGKLIYDEMINTFPKDINLALIDSSGTEQYRFKTDSLGLFYLDNIDISDELYFKIADVLRFPVTLLIYDKEGNVLAQMKNSGEGIFLFRKLKANFGEYQLLELDEQEFPSSFQMIFGKFDYRKFSMKQTEFPLVVMDEEGVFIDTVWVDQLGNFLIDNVESGKTLTFKFPNESILSEVDEVSIYNFKGVEVALLEKNPKGNFIYRPGGIEKDIDSEELLMMEHEQDKIADKSIKVYYSINAFQVVQLEAQKIQRIVRWLQEHPKARVEVSSYADSRASADYNLKLSQKRSKAIVKMLQEKGIELTRVTSNAYGENKLVNKCADGVDCPEELHEKNRRTEMIIY